MEDVRKRKKGSGRRKHARKSMLDTHSLDLSTPSSDTNTPSPSSSMVTPTTSTSSTRSNSADTITAPSPSSGENSTSKKTDRGGERDGKKSSHHDKLGGEKKKKKETLKIKKRGSTTTTTTSTNTAKSQVVPKNLSVGFNHHAELLSMKGMNKLKKHIMMQYPFLEDVWESMLVTDHTEGDVIVFVNEHFEHLTLYPSEEILGRNCRFLQGKYTNPKTIEHIRECLAKRGSVDVQILNYRKDGLPFWNCLMILPVDVEGKPYNFAIQKDITLLKDVGEGDPEKWTPPEVAMWLEYNGLPYIAAQCIKKSVDGTRLINLTQEDLVELRIHFKAERFKLLDLVRGLKEKKKSGFEEAKELAKLSGHQLPSNYTHDGKAEGSVVQGKDIWKKTPVHSEYTCKCYFKDYEPLVVLVDKKASLKVLRKILHDQTGRRMQLNFKDSDKDLLDLVDEEDFKALQLLSTDGVLEIYMDIDESYTLRPTSTSYLSCVPLPILLTDHYGYILYANPPCMELFGATKAQDVLHNSIEKYVSKVKNLSDYLEDMLPGQKKLRKQKRQQQQQEKRRKDSEESGETSKQSKREQQHEDGQSKRRTQSFREIHRVEDTDREKERGKKEKGLAKLAYHVTKGHNNTNKGSHKRVQSKGIKVEVKAAASNEITTVVKRIRVSSAIKGRILVTFM